MTVPLMCFVKKHNITLMILLMNQLTFYSRKSLKSVRPFCTVHRQMYRSAHKSKMFLLPEKVTRRLLLQLLLLQLWKCRPHRYANLQFCSFIRDH